MNKTATTLLLSLVLAGPAMGSEFDFDVPMHLKGANTFYISGRIGNMPPSDFMVDTGSSYMTINEETLASLKLTDKPVYLRDLTGVLANGDSMRVPVYAISSVQLGDGCHLEEVEVAVFPGKTRQILGLSVLLKAAPFVFSTDPPQLQLSNCGLTGTKNGDQTVLAADTGIR
jgi:predicted aspartyl protease